MAHRPALAHKALWSIPGLGQCESQSGPAQDPVHRAGLTGHPMQCVPLAGPVHHVQSEPQSEASARFVWGFPEDASTIPSPHWHLRVWATSHPMHQCMWPSHLRKWPQYSYGFTNLASLSDTLGCWLTVSPPTSFLERIINLRGCLNSPEGLLEVFCSMDHFTGLARSSIYSSLLCCLIHRFSLLGGWESEPSYLTPWAFGNLLSQPLDIWQSSIKCSVPPWH